MTAPLGGRDDAHLDYIPSDVKDYFPEQGEILHEEFLTPMALSQTQLARAIGVPPRGINEIVLGKYAITADTDLRLAR